MLQRISGVTALVALVGALVALSPSPAAAQSGNPNTNRLVVPVSGVATGVGNLTGTFAISRFAVQNGQLNALGTLTATVTDSSGAIVKTFVTQVAMPVANATGPQGVAPAAALAAGSCDILSLVLGPLHLDLLGLTIDLNQVVLDIAATAGAGNLLGNLLCSITGLLDAGALGQQLVNLLNQLIGVLGGL